MIAVVAAGCDSAAEKPTAEPPTPIPTVASQTMDTDSALGARNALANPELLECLSEQLGDGFDPDSGAIAPELFGRLGPQALSTLESCGVDVAGTFGGAVQSLSDFSDPEVQQCLAGELGADVTNEGGEFDRNILRTIDPESVRIAFEVCGLNSARRTGGGGLFGGGQRGEGRGGFASGAGDDIRECLTEELREEGLTLGRNPIGASPAEFQDALEKCGGGIAIPVEPDGGTGAGSAPIPIEPVTEPTATSIPVSELTIEHLTCLSGELDPADLTAVVVATSMGDLSEITDELLAALQTCDVGF